MSLWPVYSRSSAYSLLCKACYLCVFFCDVVLLENPVQNSSIDLDLHDINVGDLSGTEMMGAIVIANVKEKETGAGTGRERETAARRGTAIERETVIEREMIETGNSRAVFVRSSQPTHSIVILLLRAPCRVVSLLSEFTR